MLGVSLVHIKFGDVLHPFESPNQAFSVSFYNTMTAGEIRSSGDIILRMMLI